MDYSTELALATSLAGEAGKIMRDNFMAGSLKDWKSNGTPVTVTDTTINALVIKRIAEEFPGHSVLGEEESHNLGRSLTWVCDPVDGTMPFSHGVPVSTFSLALVRDGVPLLGVVYDPFMERMFWAVAGRGAYHNGKRIKVSKGGMQHALIDIAGFPSTAPVIQAGGEIIDRLFAKGAKATSLWSIILPTALVAAGEYTATIFNVDKPEDGAAVKVIVEEAGGKVTDLFGNEQRYDGLTKGFIASNGVVHDQIVEVLSTYPAI